MRPGMVVIRTFGLSASSSSSGGGGSAAAFLGGAHWTLDFGGSAACLRRTVSHSAGFCVGLSAGLSSGSCRGAGNLLSAIYKVRNNKST